MKLSKAQQIFIESIYCDNEHMSFEYEQWERRTAISLYKKGFVFFENGIPTKDDNTFLAALTDKGIDKYNEWRT